MSLPSPSITKHRLLKTANRPQIACLLCQVLWPIIVPHRHVILSELGDSKTPSPLPVRTS